MSYSIEAKFHFTLNQYTAKQWEEARKLQLENERLRLELRRATIELALDISTKINPDLSKVERADFLVKLLPLVNTLTTSELEIS